MPLNPQFVNEKTVRLFTRSMHDFRKTRCLAVTALLIAMNVSLDLLGLSIKIPPNLRIGFGFLCNASIGMLFGPAVGMFSGICTDVLGYLAGNMSMGAYFPGYTLTAMVAGLIAVPVVSLITPKMKKERLDEIFACYQTETVLHKKLVVGSEKDNED